MRNPWKRFITYPLLAAVGIAIAVEEMFWRLSALLALLSQLSAVRAIENGLGRLSPASALLTFGLPAVALVPVKLLALYWLAGGHPVLGIGTILAAKIIGTAVVARLFQLMQGQLLSFRWFRWAYSKVMKLRAEAYGLWLYSAPGRWWRAQKARRRSRLFMRWQAGRAWWARKWYLARFGKQS